MSFSLLARVEADRRSRSLGSVNWAFVITLFLLLGFIFLWYTAADERDVTKEENTKLSEAYKQGVAYQAAMVEELNQHAAKLGWRSRPVAFGPNSVTLSDLAQVDQHLSKTGEVEVDQPDGTKVKVPGFMRTLVETKIVIDQATRSGQGSGATEKVIDLSQTSAKFREAASAMLAASKSIPPKPASPVDSGDEAAQAKYRADLEAYTAAVDKWKSAMATFHSDEFKAEVQHLQKTVGLPARLDPDAWKAVELSFAPKIDVPVNSLQDALPLMRPVVEAILAEFKANKGADRGSIEKLQADLAAERKLVADQNVRYAELQTVSKGEIDAKTRDLATAEKRASDNEQAARKAENDLQVMSAERKKEVATLQAELSAYKERVFADKEQRDLRVRRDTVDGHLVAVNQALETGTIDLGSDDKVYPGLTFVVSYMDRGGARQPKGQVQVIQVTGRHSSKVRIVSATSQLGSGDLLSNPFFNAQAAIHIYTVGWTPDHVQRTRLEKMNVVLDAAPTGQTDYFVVPDDWKGGTAAPPAEGEADTAAGASPLDKARQDANNVGATLITRRMLEDFLKL